jgi:hypothetical protein
MIRRKYSFVLEYGMEFCQNNIDETVVSADGYHSRGKPIPLATYRILCLPIPIDVGDTLLLNN